MSLMIMATVVALALCFAPAMGAAATVSARRPLRGNDTLVSAQGRFELGLFSPAGSSGDRFYLGIWYKNIPGQTVIWVGNRASPLSGLASAELRVSADDGNLELVGPTGASASPVVVWSSNRSSSSSLSSSPGSNTAEIRNDGNLVLVDGGNYSNVLWQSFDHPTDTHVPGAWIGENKLTGEYQTLTSWRNAQDPAPGMFTDIIDPNGTSEFFYMWNRSRAYWRSGVWTGQIFERLPDATESITSYEETPAYRRLTNVITDNATITRLVLDLTGQAKLYIWVPATQSWQLFWSAPTMQCEVYALCGAFGVCEHRSQLPCRCPPGFAPVSEEDWTLSDWSGGCRRSSPLTCAHNVSMMDGFLALPDMKLPDGSLAVGAAQSKAECESTCQNSCSCQAYAFSSGGGGCTVWHGEIRNLEQLYADSGVSGSELHLRLSQEGLDILHGADSKKRERTLWFVLGIPFAGVATLGASVILAWRFLLARRRRLASMEYEKGSSLTVYSYEDLRATTKNFSERLGGGSFGSVYRGVLKRHEGDNAIQVQVAVKKLEGLGGQQGDKQFRAEVSTLGLIQHVNLVRLLGFCSSGDEKMLVYEYIPRGSLDRYLFDDGGMNLSWRERYRIMIGVAKGLAYLHHGCHECIIHCDIKPENILLDEDMSPRIADFGMAKLVRRDFSHALTTMRGTIGYLAPEWISGQPINAKADVYSFGMVLFELISGRRNSKGYSEVEAIGSESSDSWTFFPVWVAGKVMEGEVSAVIDSRLRGNVTPEELERACWVACWCIQDEEARRPSMAQVVQALEGVVQVHAPPVPPALQHLVTLT
ncbi:G-type lectin S-receptor-like serine/threonine-protein kinase At2g19130 [Hordeum vulgare subsp. vulgare]|uniref:Receptor-like serine/threonine-protein kinase n=1 Tax=Hordeum vulgare subsp. vulgare TaxID=112509 RepID=A0A8I6YMB1_HORVV|nr:G-type lectin S-receptor-like serine/threonine-protein kinase At2g19130 [Hordeum vulgare subsp. vulgare]